MTIYLDVLLAVNLYINYFLIRGTALLLHREVSPKRALISAAVGTLFSLTIFLPKLPFVVNAGIKLICGCSVTAAAFGFRRISEFVIDMLCFLVISFLYAGGMLALWQFVAPLGMYYRNGIAYFDIPILVVTIITALGYAAIRFMRYLSDKRCIGEKLYRIHIVRNGQEVSLNAVADTGNALCDPFSGIPIIICSRTAVESILPESVVSYLSDKPDYVEGVRLVPCISVGGSALIPIFRADSIIIDGKSISAMIGISKNELGTECIFNPRLISI